MGRPKGAYICFTLPSRGLYISSIYDAFRGGWRVPVVFHVLLFLFLLFPLAVRKRRATGPEGNSNVSSFLGHRNCASGTTRGRFLGLGGKGFANGKNLVLKGSCQLPAGGGDRKNGGRASTRTGSGGASMMRPLLNGRRGGIDVGSHRLRNTYLCLIYKRKKPSPNTVNGIKQHRLRRSRCTCSVMLHLKHTLVRGNTAIRFVVRSGGSNVHSSGCLSGDRHRAYVNDPVPLSRITHLRRHYGTVGELTERSGRGCGQTVFVRMSDQQHGRRISMFLCRTAGDALNEELTGGVQEAMRRGCSARRPGHNFRNAIDTHGLCMLQGSGPMTTFLRLNGVRGRHSHGQLVVTSGQRTLTG